MSKFIHNVSASAKTFQGQEIAPNAFFQIPLNLEDDYASDENLISDIVGGAVFMSRNGTTDITDGIDVQIAFLFSIDIEAIKEELLENNRFKVDVIGSLENGRVKTSSADTTPDFLESKIEALNSKTSVTKDNEVLKIGVVPSNINTSELNNDASFINASQAPVQQADIANFENTTQLNARDVNNRNRANHSGSQPASSIQNFGNEVRNEQTVTSLTLDQVTDVLTFEKEDGTTDAINLAIYKDNTNLAQIVSGTLNQATGVVTFTRDDNSTFTVDFSSLNDQAAINQAINAHEQSIANHNDIDISGILNGQTIVWNGSTFVAGTVNAAPFTDRARTNTPAATQSTSYQNYLRLTVNVPETGLYEIKWDSTWSLNNTQSNFLARVQIDDTNTIDEFAREPQDAGGVGILVDSLEGASFNSGTDQRYKYNGFEEVILTQGQHTVDLDLACQTANQRATFYRGIIKITKA